MMLRHPFLIGLATLTLLTASADAHEAARGIVAIQVARAETVGQGTIEHAVILVENGKVVAVGEDLVVERGIPILDRSDWTVIPGLVDCRSRYGMDSNGGSGSDPQILASTELYPRGPWSSVRDRGVTTLGLFPDGRGIPGQSVVVRPSGSTVAEMVLRDRAYLVIYLRSSASSKKMLKDGFEGVDEYLEKEQKAFEKWEKAKEKIEKSNKDKEKDERDEVPTYSPPAPDADVSPFMDLREGKLSVLFSIAKASDWLHLNDAIGEEEFSWDLHIPLRNDIDLHYVLEQIGEREGRVVVQPMLTLMPNTRRERNLPAELARAGARVALTPNGYSLSSYDRWLRDVAYLVSAGMDRGDALAAMTLVPAEVLRVADRVGSIEAGKDANLVFLDGDPFEVGTQIKAVMLEGDLLELDEEED